MSREPNITQGTPANPLQESTVYPNLPQPIPTVTRASRDPKDYFPARKLARMQNDRTNSTLHAPVKRLSKTPSPARPARLGPRDTRANRFSNARLQPSTPRADPMESSESDVVTTHHQQNLTSPSRFSEEQRKSISFQKSTQNDRSDMAAYRAARNQISPPNGRIRRISRRSSISSDATQLRQNLTKKRNMPGSKPQQEHRESPCSGPGPVGTSLSSSLKQKAQGVSSNICVQKSKQPSVSKEGSTATPRAQRTAAQASQQKLVQGKEPRKSANVSSVNSVRTLHNDVEVISINSDSESSAEEGDLHANEVHRDTDCASKKRPRPGNACLSEVIDVDDEDAILNLERSAPRVPKSNNKIFRSAPVRMSGAAFDCKGNATKSGLYFDRGGALFNVNSAGTVEILDSEDEADVIDNEMRIKNAESSNESKGVENPHAGVELNPTRKDNVSDERTTRKKDKPSRFTSRVIGGNSNSSESKTPPHGSRNSQTFRNDEVISGTKRQKRAEEEPNFTNHGIVRNKISTPRISGASGSSSSAIGQNANSGSDSPLLKSGTSPEPRKDADASTTKPREGALDEPKQTKRDVLSDDPTTTKSSRTSASTSSTVGQNANSVENDNILHASRNLSALQKEMGTSTSNGQECLSKSCRGPNSKNTQSLRISEDGLVLINLLQPQTQTAAEHIGEKSAGLRLSGLLKFEKQSLGIASIAKNGDVIYEQEACANTQHLGEEDEYAQEVSTSSSFLSPASTKKDKSSSIPSDTSGDNQPGVYSPLLDEPLTRMQIADGDDVRPQFMAIVSPGKTPAAQSPEAPTVRLNLSGISSHGKPGAMDQKATEEGSPTRESTEQGQNAEAVEELPEVPLTVEHETVLIDLTIEPPPSSEDYMDQDISMEGLSARGIRSLLRQNSETADATEEAESPKELSVQLLPHQKRALAWMLKREKPLTSEEEVVAVDEQCLGGILADDQGLGKTLSMLALIASTGSNSQSKGIGSLSVAGGTNNSASAGAPASEGQAEEDRDSVFQRYRDSWKTLVVCPLSVTAQWKEELESKTKENYRPSVYIYHGPRRERHPERLANFDVVITTYTVLVQDYPKLLKDHPEFVFRKSQKLPLPTRKPSGVYEVAWRRVVLDEAHYVKNRSTESWLAVMSLRADFRWCMTGTPIQNSVDDLYSLFCFIRYRFVPNYEKWNTQWKKKLEHPNARVRSRVFKRFQAVAGVVLLRRMKTDIIEGQPLINLPERICKVVTTGFVDEEEIKFYKAMQAKTIISASKFLLDGSLMMNYSSVLLMLLRLRQACSHPFLIQYSGIQNDSMVSSNQSTSLEQVYTKEQMQVAQQLATAGHSLLNFIDEKIRGDVFNWMRPQKKGSVITNGYVCSLCGCPCMWQHGWAFSCGEVTCTRCRDNILQSQICPRCKRYFPSKDPAESCVNAEALRIEVHANVFLYEAQNANLNVTGSEFKALMKREIERRVRSHTPYPSTSGSTGNSESTVGKETQDGTKRLLAALCQQSTKMRTILNELQKIRDRGEGEKTLIFSQWTSMLDIIEFHLRISGYCLCRLDGTMSLSMRQKQLKSFKEDSSKTVFIISLHSGCTGLNLTAANNVILADVWWNPAVEEQAIDRVHRIGQTRAVNVTRIKMQGTVEEKIYALCEKKRQTAQGTLGQAGGQNYGRTKLSRQELISLFSSTAEDVMRNAAEGTEAAEAARALLETAGG